MADDLEKTLAAGIENDEGLKAMAARLAPRNPPPDTAHIKYAPPLPSGSVEMKLQEIERLVREIRATSAQVKGLLG
jgi:hypothetical protein